MKSQFLAKVGMVLCIIGFYFINFNQLSAQVGIKYLGGVHGPPDNTSLSPSFLTFRSNRGQQMLGQIAGGYSVQGSGYSQSAVEAMDYSKMVVTPSFESWHAVVAPETGEHGNVRYDEGFYLYINGGTFIPSQVSVNTKSEIWNGEGWVVGGGINITTTLSTVHSARIRMNSGTNGTAGDSDDQVHSVQTGSQASTGFVFLSPAVGLAAFGSGTDQQKVQNTIDWLNLNKLRLVHTVSGTSTLGTFSFTKTNEPPKGNLDGLGFRINGSPVSSVSWTSDGQAYVLQRSFDLANWTDLGLYWQPSGTIVTSAVSIIEGQPKVFWRLARQ